MSFIAPRCSCPDHVGRFRATDMARAQRDQKRAWQRARKAEVDYGRQLRAVADQIGRLVDALAPSEGGDDTALQNALRQYSTMLKPWATAVSTRMLADVKRRDASMWEELTKEMGLSIRQEIARAPTGKLLVDMMAENVGLITSLPIEAGQRVHELVIESLETSGRAKEIADDIMRTGLVTRSRAMLIARTEVSRAASGLIEARATYIGSEGYFWTSAGDADVRNVDGNPVGSHRLLNGKFIKWSEPPVASTNGMRYHAGQGPNCRCYPRPQIPMEF